MEIDKHIGKVVVIELDTSAKHEGVLEDAENSYVKIINGAEVFFLPRHEIIDIQLVQGKGFIFQSLK